MPSEPRTASLTVTRYVYNSKVERGGIMFTRFLK